MFHSVRGEWRGAGLSREEITCILSLLGDLRGCASYGPGRRQIHSYFCDLHCRRKAHPGAAWLAWSETHFFLLHPPARTPYSLTLSHGLACNRGRLFCWSFPLHFPSAHRRGGTAIRLLFGKVHGTGCGSTRLSFQFSVFTASTPDPGTRALAHRNGFLHVRCSSAVVFFALCRPALEFVFSFLRTHAWRGRLSGRSEPRESVCLASAFGGDTVVPIRELGLFKGVFSTSLVRLY